MFISVMNWCTQNFTSCGYSISMKQFLMSLHKNWYKNSKKFLQHLRAYSKNHRLFLQRKSQLRSLVKFLLVCLKESDGYFLCTFDLLHSFSNALSHTHTHTFFLSLEHTNSTLPQHLDNNIIFQFFLQRT